MYVVFIGCRFIHSVAFITLSSSETNDRGETGSPCLFPSSAVNHSLRLMPTFAANFDFSSAKSIMFPRNAEAGQHSPMFAVPNESNSLVYFTKQLYTGMSLSRYLSGYHSAISLNVRICCSALFPQHYLFFTNLLHPRFVHPLYVHSSLAKRESIGNYDVCYGVSTTYRMEEFSSLNVIIRVMAAMVASVLGGAVTGRVARLRPRLGKCGPYGRLSYRPSVVSS